MKKVVNMSAVVFSILALLFGVVMTAVFKWSGLYMSLIPIGVAIIALELFRIRKAIERQTELTLLGSPRNQELTPPLDQAS